MLSEQLQTLLQRGWRLAFPTTRTHQRAMQHAIALPCVLGRRTITRTLCALGRSAQDWSADYKLFSRCRWQAEQLFQPVLDEHLQRYPQGPIFVAVDDTKLRKTGKKIPGTGWQRDPLSPPFHVNFLYGLRFLQASLLFPHYREGDYSARALPVRFQAAAVVKKPGKRAAEEQLKQYKLLKQIKNLSTQTLELLRGLRTNLDERGGSGRLLLMVGDGSFCNKTIFRAQSPGIAWLARCRKDARLCFAAPAAERRKYAQEIFTPEQVRQNTELGWQRVQIHFGGKRRWLRYKEVQAVLWKRGSGTRPLRLLVIAPVPYKLSKHSHTNYRQPAYFLSTDLTTSTKLLVQACFDRWQIEVNHRDEKDILGVGQAQVWSTQSVPRQPALAVAAYSMLLLAALREFGPGRTDNYVLQPRWRKESQRPSFLDIVTLLRKECSETSVSHLLHPNFAQNLTLYADT
jgi:DDE superfamily endonuclease